MVVHVLMCAYNIHLVEDSGLRVITSLLPSCDVVMYTKAEGNHKEATCTCICCTKIQTTGHVTHSVTQPVRMITYHTHLLCLSISCCLRWSSSRTVLSLALSWLSTSLCRYADCRCTSRSCVCGGGGVRGGVVLCKDYITDS